MKQLAGPRPLLTAAAATISAGMIALTPTVSNDLAADIQHSMTDLQQRAVELTDYVANPIQDWITTFQAAGTNLSSLYTQFQQYPFADAQQIAANFLQYAVQYVTPYQAAGNDAVSFFLGTSPENPVDFVPQVAIGLADLQAGNFAAGIPALTSTIWGDLAVGVLQSLETIPRILNPITQNIANATDYLTTTWLGNVPGYFATWFMSTVFDPIGVGVQNVYNSLAAGDPLGAVINTIDIPALVTNSVLNGTLNTKTGLYNAGLIADGNPGLLKYFIIVTPQGLAKDMVAPGAQNIMSGGSLEYALGYLANVVTTGFPTPQTVFDNLVNVIQTYAAIPSAAAAAVTSGGDFAALAPAASSVMAGLSGGLPGLSADALKAFDPAMVTNIAASLGPSLGSSLGANLAGSLATTLSVDLSTLALHILSAL